MPLTEYRNTDSIDIGQRPDDVFDFVSDATNDPAWCPDVSDTVRIEDTPDGMPAYRFQQHFRDSQHEERLAFTELTRPGRMRSTMTVYGADVDSVIDLEADGDGTRLTHTNTMRMPWRLIWQRPFRQRSTKRLMRVQLENLKRLLEETA